jgi:hypothetical protein
MALACASGGTPPMASPVTSRTNAASALSTGSPRSAATFRSSTRWAPLAMTSTGRPDAARKTSDFAIRPASQPSTRAASADVRAGTAYSMTAVATPCAASASATRCALGGSGLDGLNRGYRGRTSSSTSSSHSVPGPCSIAPTST